MAHSKVRTHDAVALVAEDIESNYGIIAGDGEPAPIPVWDLQYLHDSAPDEPAELWAELYDVVDDSGTGEYYTITRMVVRGEWK